MWGFASVGLCAPLLFLRDWFMRIGFAWFGLADAIGLEAHDAPESFRIAHVDTRISVAPRKIAVCTDTFHLGATGDEGGRSVKANLAVVKIDGLEAEVFRCGRERVSVLSIG